MQTSMNRIEEEFLRISNSLNLTTDKIARGDTGFIVYFRKNWRTLASVRLYYDLNHWWEMIYIVSDSPNTTAMRHDRRGLERRVDSANGEAIQEMFEAIKQTLVEQMSAMELMVAQVEGGECGQTDRWQNEKTTKQRG